MKKEVKIKKRRAGVLMPVSSLPSSQGIGTLGKGAYAFVDWLESADMRVWQVLPLLPTGYGDSPYQSFASDALNYYFIDFELLEQDGLLEREDYSNLDWGEDERRVDYGRQFEQKTKVLRKAFEAFDTKDSEWQAFLKEGKYFDFAVFMSLKLRFSYAPWSAWAQGLGVCDKKAVQKHIKEYAKEIEFWQFTQFLFLRQWQKLKAYANGKGIKIMGDMPIYLAYDSVETWKKKNELFMLDNEGNISTLAGVPPDAFCEDGQFWGNPVYDWKKQAKDGYSWWRARIEYAFTLFDIVRIDHFRAFDRFYAVPATAETAREGEWLDGPKEALFTPFANKEIVAEDLGTIDAGVRRLMKNTGYPGMKVFEFAFNGDPENEYLPSKYDRNCVAYTGTHDNDTLYSFIDGMGCEERKAFTLALEEECLQADVPYIRESVEDECESVVRLLFASKADTVIVPMQDILGMGTEARLNAPATVSSKNWTFRFTERDLKKRKAAWLKEMVAEYKR